MSPAVDPLTTLAESVADGESIDWDALDALAADPELRGLVEHLRVVAGIAEVHRTQTDEIDESPQAAAPTLTTDDTPDQRERWGHLALVRKLGQGAFGEVYLAHDTWLDHPRALKLLKPEVASRLSPEQLLHEARKLVRVRHPNVVAVHGADRHDGRVGFWMDFVDGQTLGERVDEACLEPEDASAIGRELCDALAAVHRAGLIHRDIKAQNVMRGADGRIFLMDFGAGEFMGASPSGRPQGTPLYLAPELFSGGAASVQSDIYAVGVLLYHLVTGEFPVQAGSVTELIKAHGAKAGVSLRDTHPELPARLVDAVERALDADPVKRFASAEEMRDALTEPPSLTSSQVIEIVHVEAPASKLWTWTFRLLIALVSAVVMSGLMGYLGWRTFQLALHVEAGFAPSVREYFRLGTEGLMPFLIYGLMGAGIFALVRGADTVLGAPVTRIVRARTAAMDDFAVVRLAAGLCLCAFLGWTAVIITHWSLFDTVFGLQSGTAGLTTPALSPAFKAVHTSYTEKASWLTAVLAFAALYVFPSLDRQRPGRSTLRAFEWTAVILAILMMCSATAPRRLAWDSFSRVLYENQPMFVIGSRGDELLLYSPSRPQTGNLRVRVGDGALAQTNKNGLLVDP